MHIDHTHFTPGSALLGGCLIGLSASLLLLFYGRIAGISGIFAGLFSPAPHQRGWRAAFVLGLLAAGLLLVPLRPDLFAVEIARSVPALLVAGFLVGFGSRLGNGCTSGHGVCGISRLSRRSLLATATFMASALLTVTIINRFFGGRL